MRNWYLIPVGIFTALFTWSVHALSLEPEHVTYNYRSDIYTNATPPFSLDDRVTGELRLIGATQPYLDDVDVEPILFSYHFDDGVRLWTLDNSAICNFTISTDGLGNIVAWGFLLVESPRPPVGDPQRFLTGSTFSGNVYTDSTSADGNDCDSIDSVFAVERASGGAGGWSTEAQLLSRNPTRYSYAGRPLNLAESPYTPDNRVQGYMTADRPLPPNSKISNLSTALVDYSFSDGEQTRTQENSYPCKFEITTDSRGNITDWNILLGERSHNFLLFETLAEFLKISSTSDQGGLASFSPTEPCDSAPVSSPMARNSNNPGTWQHFISGTGSSDVPTIPSLNSLGLIALIISLMGVGFSALRRV